MVNRVKDYNQTVRVRGQAPPRAPWELQEDARAGFAQSVHNNQTQMALYYARELFAELDATIENLKAEVAELKKPQTGKTQAPVPTRAKKIEVESKSEEVAESDRPGD